MRLGEGKHVTAKYVLIATGGAPITATPFPASST